MLALFRHHILRALLVAHSLQRLLWMARRLFTYALLRVQPAGSLFMVQTRAQRVQGGQSLQDAVARLAEAARAQPRRAPVSDKHAGCLVPLFEDGAGVVRVWLTRRSKQLRTHAGEVCLPGGRRDEEDCGDDAVTALREAQEELGLDPSAARVVCKLPPFLSKHYLSVTPVVAQVPADFTPAINPAEVDAAFHMPLAAFLEADHHLHWDVGGARGGGLRYRIHSFDHIDGREHYVIWGLTASMLIRVAELAFGRAPAFEVNGRGCTCLSQLFFDGAAAGRGGGESSDEEGEPHAAVG